MPVFLSKPELDPVSHHQESNDYHSPYAPWIIAEVDLLPNYYLPLTLLLFSLQIKVYRHLFKGFVVVVSCLFTH
jgi:hypothetical protein